MRAACSTPKATNAALSAPQPHPTGPGAGGCRASAAAKSALARLHCTFATRFTPRVYSLSELATSLHTWVSATAGLFFSRGETGPSTPQTLTSLLHITCKQQQGTSTGCRKKGRPPLAAPMLSISCQVRETSSENPPCCPTHARSGKLAVKTPHAVQLMPGQGN